MEIQWPYPFTALEDADHKPTFEAELLRELKPGHALFGIPVRTIGRRFDQDDFLFELLDGSGRVAQVHLTWAGEPERLPWPCSVLFSSFTAWAETARDEYGELIE